jgi:hypothetical protein
MDVQGGGDAARRAFRMREQLLVRVGPLCTCVNGLATVYVFVYTGRLLCLSVCLSVRSGPSMFGCLHG